MINLFIVAWKLIPKITGGPMTGVGRLLNARAFDLRATATDVLQSIWANLIVIDYHGGQITINQNLDGKLVGSSFHALLLTDCRGSHNFGGCHNLSDSN
jgi:hypothetical protein